MNDYFILPNDLFAVVYNSCMLVISERIEFDHMPVELFVHLPNERELNANRSDENEFIDKVFLEPI